MHLCRAIRGRANGWEAGGGVMNLLVSWCGVLVGGGASSACQFSSRFALMEARL